MEVKPVAGGGMAPLPAGVVTFLLSDVAGSSRLWEAHGQTALAAIARHHELLDAAIALHRGMRPVEQGEGDSVVGAFPRPSDALAAALYAQRAFAAEPWPDRIQLRVRLALHSGEAQLRDGGSFEPALIRAARLRAAAHPGQTLLSNATRDLVTGLMPDGATLRDLGLHRLKDLRNPERVWQLVHPDLENDFPPLCSLDAARTNLPVQLTSFVGRNAELVELHKLLKNSRVVTLTGAGGCGKTRLAVHTAAEAVDCHPDGVWWVELGSLSDPALVPYAVARIFGLREEARPLVDTLCEQLRNADTLVVLDNCEHVVAACAELVDRLMRSVPALRVLATSREPLGIQGEVTWRVPSLDDESALHLFLDRAAQVRPGFSLDAPEAEVVTQICRRLDGIPLAIELAAARTRMMPVARIGAALDDRFRLLTGGGRAALPRQQALELSVAWSHDLLDPDERAVLRRLSVFAGGFTLEAAEAVAAGEPIDTYAVLDLVSRLVDKSLVQVDHGAEGRYRLLETIRLYAGQRLIDSGEADGTRDRHLAYFLDFAERTEPELVRAHGAECLDQLEQEHSNLRAALDWADTTGAYDPLLRLTTALTLFFELRSHLAEGGRCFARALARDEGLSVARARALWGAAHVAFYGDDYEAMIRRVPEALEMARSVGDEWAIARALNTNAVIRAWLTPEHDEARTLLEESIAFGQKVGDDWAVADGLKMLTVAWIGQDDYEGLSRALPDYLRSAQRLGNQFFMSWYHTTVGWAETHLGDLARAERELQTAFDIDAVIGGTATDGIATALLGEVEALTGRYEAAERRLGPFRDRGNATGDALGVPIATISLAHLKIGQGALSEALTLLEPLVGNLRPFGCSIYLAWALPVLGLAHLSAGNEQAAEDVLVEARRAAAAWRNPWLAAQVDQHLGELASRRGDARHAEDLHHQALAQRARARLRPGMAESLEALARLATAHESYLEAARLFGAATALRASTGLARWPVDQAGYEGDVARAREGLGEDAFAAAWVEGEALSLDHAVAYATRARGERKRPSAGWASLTPTELEVVKLTAQGLTNPEIGQRLFMGRATVKTHLAHIFAKLGISTRAELAAAATRRGL